MERQSPRVRYFKYLYSIVNKGDYHTVPYIHLFQYMYDTPFTYTIENDQARFNDAMDFRNRFIAKYKYTGEDALNVGNPTGYVGVPSVLEVLIALCVRIENSIMKNDDLGDRTPEFFWNIMSNLGIAHLNDSLFDSSVVEAAMERLVNRTYEPDGVNGPFYLREPREDLRRVDLWYQCMWYLSENYED